MAGAADASASVGWYKEEAVKFFMPKIDEHPKDAITHRIDLFYEARLTPDGYKKVINRGDPHNIASETDKLVLQEKCLFLMSALNDAIENYPIIPWTQICNPTSNAGKKLGHSASETMIQKFGEMVLVNRTKKR